MTDKEGKADAQPFHLVLLAKDDVGYRNLCRLVTDAHLDGYYYKPRIDREHLARHSEGLDRAVGLPRRRDPAGPRDRRLGARPEAGRRVRRHLRQGRLLPRAPGPRAGRAAPAQRAAPPARARGRPAARRDQRPPLRPPGPGRGPRRPALRRDRQQPRHARPDALRGDRLLPQVGGPDGGPLPRPARGAPQHPPDRRDDRRPRRCPSARLRIPHFPVPDGETVESWLRAGVPGGLARRYGTVTPELQERLDYELRVITSMGYAGYFLIVADFVRFAREQRIQTTCRGSAPGSIVTYTLGITPVDPILYQLPFERFLNPDRVTMPDIDVDFEDGRREEVIAYVGRKYGQDHVAQIITFGTMLARAAIRDVGRVLGMSYGDVDRIAKAVPNQLGIKLDEALQIAAAVPRDGRGRPPGRQAGRPRQAARGGGPQRQHPRRRRRHQPRAADRAHAAPAGDELGRADDPVRDARRRGARPPQVRLPGPVEPDDPAPGGRAGEGRPGGRDRPRRASRSTTPKTFELLASGETTGIFQLESAGMRRYIRELRPTSVYDLAAMVALYRPGPMDNIPAYIRRKHGQEPVTYLHPLLEPYLEKTYGIFVYQEDIMAAAIALGGFTGPGGRHARLRDPQEEVVGPARPEGEVRHPGGRAGRPGGDDRRGLQGLRAVRALRLQQGPRHLLRPGRLPDGLPQGELHGRVHDQRPDRRPRHRREGRRGDRRVPPDGDRGPAPGRPPLGRRVHRRGRRDPVRPAGREERRPGRDRVDHRGPRRGRPVPLADRLLLADRPPPGQPQGPRGAGQGRGAQRLRAPGPDPARARRRPGRRRRDPARPDLRPDLAVRDGRRAGGARRAAADRARDADPRAAPLGEGAPRAVPLGPSRSARSPRRSGRS